MSTTPFVLFRTSTLSETSELAAMQRYLSTTDDMDAIPSGSVIFPRFRSIPFGEELAASAVANGSRLVNTWVQYTYIASLLNWVDDLSGITPAAYQVSEIGNLPEGEYFVKGETNSKKDDWNTSAFAANLDAIDGIIGNLQGSSTIKEQEIVIRPFVRYRQLGVQPTGQPIFNEVRVFVLDGQVMASGFYWSLQRSRFSEEATKPLIPENFDATLNEAIRRIGDKASFVVIDLAEHPDGRWDVIELNDANMSGLTGVDADTLWRNVARHYSENS